MDTEMSLMIQLQNAYGANAKVISAVQSMFTATAERGELRRRAMSGSVAGMGASDYGMMSSLVGDSTSIKQKLDQLTSQASSGYVSNTYAGLGAGAAVSLDLSPQIASLQTWQNNIDAASGRMQVTQTAMTQIQQIASNLATQIDTLNTVSPSGIDTIAAQARSALAELGSLLDTQNGNDYVFAGQDTTNPPVPGPAQPRRSHHRGLLRPDRGGRRRPWHQRRGRDHGSDPCDRWVQRGGDVAILRRPVATGRHAAGGDRSRQRHSRPGHEPGGNRRHACRSRRGSGRQHQCDTADGKLRHRRPDRPKHRPEVGRNVERWHPPGLRKTMS